MVTAIGNQNNADTPTMAEPIFSVVDRMVISTGRLVADGLVSCAPVASTFAILCGAEAADSLAAFHILMWRLRHDGWRQLRILPSGMDHQPTPDEHAILGLIAATQAQDVALLDARIRWLVKPGAHYQTETAATVVGMALAMNGHNLLSAGR